MKGRKTGTSTQPGDATLVVDLQTPVENLQETMPTQGSVFDDLKDEPETALPPTPSVAGGVESFGAYMDEASRMDDEAAEQAKISEENRLLAEQQFQQEQAIEAVQRDQEARRAAQAVEEGVTQGLQMEEDMGDLRESERRPPFTQRVVEERVDKWTAAPAPDATADGGMRDRAKNVMGYMDSANITSTHAIGLGQAMNAIDNTGRFDPNFSMTLAAVTENLLAESALGGDPYSEMQRSLGLTEEEGQMEMFKEGTSGSPSPKTAVSKAQGNLKLGQEINREYQRVRNQALGLPTDSYSDLDAEQATKLGDMAKEIYFEANRNKDGRPMLRRELGNDGQVYFAMMPNLVRQYTEGKEFRRKMFNKPMVRPLKNKQSPTGQPVGESQQSVKKVSGKKGEGRVTSFILEQAARNMHTVGHVVDKQRLKILLATILPSLTATYDSLANDPLISIFANATGIGQDRILKFQAEQDKLAKSGVPSEFNWEREFKQFRTNIAQQLFGIAKERNGINYLTYYIMAFNGRFAPQQTHFDPTTSKITRFVTRSPNIVQVKPGSIQEKNLIQMYALTVGAKGTDGLLPINRAMAIEEQSGQLESWGKRLIQVLENSETDAQIEATAAAIDQGVSVMDPKFPKVNLLGLDPNADAALLKAIKDKGEDGLVFIDALTDFAKYQAAKRRGAIHYTTLNAYIDGKTNGIASNGLQMGDENIALRTGVTRSDYSVYAVDFDRDIRDELKDILLQSIDSGFEGSMTADEEAKLITLATSAFSTRDLNKLTTMTFGYGKEIESFGNDIESTLYENAQKDPAVAAALEWATQQDKIDVYAQLVSKYAEGLAMVMSEKGIESRHMMWGVAAVNAMADTLFEMESPVGLKMRFGGTDLDPEKTKSLGSYKLLDTSTGKPKARKAYMYGTKATSSAIRNRIKKLPDGEIQVTEDVGGDAWGGAVPGPVQSIDAATVALTFTGKSWDRLTRASGGNPYLFQIYDAFKMDVNGYHVVLEEVNRNWYETAMKWSYLKEARKSLDAADAVFKDTMKQFKDKELVDLNDFKYINYLLNGSVSKKGFPLVLKRKLKSLAPYPMYKTSAERDAWAYQTTLALMKATGIKPGVTNVPARNVKLFYDMFMGEIKLKKRLDDLIDRTEKDKAKLAEQVRSVKQYYTH